MNNLLKNGLIGTVLGGVIAFAPLSASGQTEEQIRLAFRNIRSDDIPFNGAAASEWIYAHRDQLKGALLDELYRTDRQGRDAILHALFHAKDFKPDIRFCRLLISRLREQDKYIKEGDLDIAAHWEAWPFMDRNFEEFKPLLMESLQSTNDMWVIWATIYLLHKRGILEAEMPGFSPHVWSVAAKSLEADKIEYNASQAVRFYLIIGRPSLPYLQAIKKSRDEQARDYASATIDAIGGSHKAYGYLGSEIALTRGLFSGERGEPEWMIREVEKWQSDNSTPKRYR